MIDELFLEDIKRRVFDEIGAKSFSRPFFKSLYIPIITNVGIDTNIYNLGNDIYYLINKEIDAPIEWKINLGSPDNYFSTSKLEYDAMAGKIISFRNYLEVKLGNLSAAFVNKPLKLDFMIIVPE